MYPSTSATRSVLSVCGVWGARHPVKTCNLGTSHTLLPWFKLMVSPVLVEWLGSNAEKCR